MGFLVPQSKHDLLAGIERSLLKIWVISFFVGFSILFFDQILQKIGHKPAGLQYSINFVFQKEICEINCDSNLSIAYIHWYTLLVVFNHCKTRILFITGPWKHNSAACSIIRTWSCLADILREREKKLVKSFLWNLIQKFPIQSCQTGERKKYR